MKAFLKLLFALPLAIPVFGGPTNATPPVEKIGFVINLEKLPPGWVWSGEKTGNRSVYVMPMVRGPAEGFIDNPRPITFSGRTNSIPSTWVSDGLSTRLIRVVPSSIPGSFLEKLKKVTLPKEGESNQDLLVRYLKESKLEVRHPSVVWFDEHTGEILVHGTADEAKSVTCLVNMVSCFNWRGSAGSR